MRFACDECGRSYVASDDVAGRAFRMRCKQCGSDIVVRPPLAAPTPFSPPPASNGEPRREPRRSSFDPFEGDVLSEGDVAVSNEALEILDRTPAPKLIPRPAAPRAEPAPPRPAPPPAPRSHVPRARAGRMLPAEDEAMLGPPGAEDRRAVPRWAIALVVAVGALAAAGGFVLLR